MRGPEREGKGQVPQTIFLDTASQRGMTRWRGPVRPQRERAEQPPPLSGREEANRPRKKGEDCLSTASSAAPEGGDSLRAKKPDNSGGASWFVLLAVEKNEHTGSPRTRCEVQCMSHPAPDAGSREGPLVGIAFAGIPCPGISGFRIKCGMTGSTASQRGMTWSTASNAE